MKKGFLSLLLLIGVLPILMTALSITVSAATEECFTYTVSNGQAKITNCSTSISGNITIPRTLGGYPVTSIEDRAFSYCSSLTSITIPNNVIRIGNSAFYSCDNLTSVTIGNSVTTIGDYAFRYCNSLTSITIPDSVTNIGDEAFRYCDSLKSVTILDSITSIGNYAFCDCYSLIDVNIGNNVTSIGDYAFSYCYSLTSITIPDSVTSIGDYAFRLCDSLESVNIGNSVKSIGNYAFLWCEDLRSITIPNSITCIGEGTFSYCSNLIVVTIPDSLTSIGNRAFSNCNNLTNIYYCGNNQEWKSISIGSDNQCLINANVYYSDWPVNIQSAVCLYDGTKVVANVKLGNVTQKGILIFAIYNEEKLIEAKTMPTSNEIFNYLIEFDEDKIYKGYEIKVFCWENTLTLKPLSETYTTEITINNVLDSDHTYGNI